MYTPSNIIVLKVKNDFPKMGLVLAVFVVGPNWILVHTTILVTQEHANHYHGYIVKYITEQTTFSLDELYNP